MNSLNLVYQDKRKGISLPVSTDATVLDLVELHKQHSGTATVSSNNNVQKLTISKKTEHLIVVLIFVVAIMVFFLIKKFR